MTDGNKMFGSNDQATGEGLTYIGEGRKYATVEELDKAYAHVNDHVGTLETENQTLREQLEKLRGQDDAVAKVLDALKKPTVQDSDRDPADAHQGVKTEELESVVESLLRKEKERSQRQENNQKVRNTLKERFGDRAEEVYRQKGQSLGIDLDSLSETSPAAVLELFKAENNQQSAQHSTFNSNTLESNTPKVGTHAYWEKLYKEKQISREEKFRQQHRSLEKLGQDYWK